MLFIGWKDTEFGRRHVGTPFKAHVDVLDDTYGGQPPFCVGFGRGGGDSPARPSPPAAAAAAAAVCFCLSWSHGTHAHPPPPKGGNHLSPESSLFPFSCGEKGPYKWNSSHDKQNSK
ncbi:hypothetical protein GW17_00025763 [Ensete ventricosum]|nr:hypothetical protein GW17_00025763 [Ensete ventricosum]